MSKERLEEIKEKVIIEKAHFKNIETGESGWTKIVTLSEEHFNYIIQQAERVEELEKKVQRYEQKFEEILELGWTENFGGSYVNMGEYHADAIQIAESALGRSKRNE